MSRRIIVYRNYFIDFYGEQNNKVQEKIEYVLDLIRFEERVPIKFLKSELSQLSKTYEFSVFSIEVNLLF